MSVRGERNGIFAVLADEGYNSNITVHAQYEINKWKDTQLDHGVFTRLWLVEAASEPIDTYTIRNLASGKYMTPFNGSNVVAVDRKPNTTEHWTIASDEYQCTVKDPNSSGALVGIQDNSASVILGASGQKELHTEWHFKRVSRSGAEIRTAMLRRLTTKHEDFYTHTYQVEGEYLIFPRGFFARIWKNIPKRPHRQGIYDSDHSATAFKVAVATMGSDYIKADGLSILCGLMLGRPTPPAAEGQKAFNFTLTDDYLAVVFFDSDTGEFKDEMGYDPHMAYF